MKYCSYCSRPLNSEKCFSTWHVKLLTVRPYRVPSQKSEQVACLFCGNSTSTRSRICKTSETAFTSELLVTGDFMPVAPSKNSVVDCDNRHYQLSTHVDFKNNDMFMPSQHTMMKLEEVNIENFSQTNTLLQTDLNYPALRSSESVNPFIQKLVIYVPIYHFAPNPKTL